MTHIVEIHTPPTVLELFLQGIRHCDIGQQSPLTVTALKETMASERKRLRPSFTDHRRPELLNSRLSGLHHHEFANLTRLRILDLNGLTCPGLLFNKMRNRDCAADSFSD